MNETLKFRKKWETGQDKEELTVILATPMTVLEIFRKPLTIIRTVLFPSTISGEILYLMTNGRLALGVPMIVFI